MEPHRKGDLTEAIVLTELKRRGVAVALPFGDNERYDAVAETPSGTIVRLQIKTGRLREGTVRFDGTTCHTNSQGNVHKPYQDDTDFFLVYCYELEQLYLIDESSVGDRMRLRVEEPEKYDPKINDAEDYLFDERWPLNDEGATSREKPSAHERSHRELVDRVIDRFDELGVSCFLPNHNGSAYDFLVEVTDTTFYRVKARSASVTGGRIQMTVSNEAGSGDTKVDHYSVYCPDTDDVYLVPSTEVNPSVCLRVGDPEQIRESTKWAEDFELSEVWPPTGAPSVSGKTAQGKAISAFERNDSVVGSVSNDCCSYDLLIETGGDIHRVVVVERWLSRGCLRLKPDSLNEIDWFVVYYRGNDTCYVVAVDSFAKSISLRVEPPEKSDSSIVWAEEHVLDSNWPPS